MENEIEKLEIHNGSLFELENECKNFPKDSARTYLLKADSVKAVSKLGLILEIVTAEVVAEIFADYERRGKPLAPSSRAEVRRTMAPLDKRYVSAKRNLNTALATKDTIEALAKSWEAKGYMIREIGKLSERTHFNEPVIYKKGRERRAEEDIIEEKMQVAEDMLNVE